MNKRGQTQTLGLGIITALFCLIVGVMFLNFITPEVSRTQVDLNCASDDISHGTMLLCLMVGGTVPYWIIIVFSIVIGLITARLSIT